ncbi:MAG: DUF885 family protein [Clostridia bacterium]
MAGRVPSPGALAEDTALRDLSDETTETLLDRYPMWATDLGLHSRDEMLGDLSPGGRAAYVRTLRKIERGLGQLEPTGLSSQDRVDHAILLNAVALALDDEEQQQAPRSDPTLYNAHILGGLLSLVRRGPEAGQRRAAAVLARLAAVPTLLEQALQQLDNPPRLFVDVAADQGEAMAAWLEGELPKAFSDAPAVTDSAREAAFRVRRYLDRLTDPIRPASGDFRMGSRRFLRRLQLQEHGTWDLVRLLHRGYDELNAGRDGLARVLSELRCARTPVEEVAALRRDPLPPGELAAVVRAWLDSILLFLHEHDLLDVDDDARPRVEPPAAGSLGEAPLNVIHPGPFGAAATGAVEVNPHPSLYRWAIPVETVRAAIPGRYWVRHRTANAPRRLRRILPAPGLHAGFPAYAVSMMGEEGLFREDARYRAAAVLYALEQAGRLIVAIRLHADDMTLDESVQFLVDQCFMTPSASRAAAIEAALHPLAGIELAQKLALRDLRRDLEQGGKGKYSARQFHDQVLAHGFTPVPLLKELLAPTPSRHTNICLW